jgi:Secretion system C-terminal sorting domain/Fibronectin type III domain
MKHFYFLFSIVFLALFVMPLQAQKPACSLPKIQNLTISKITATSAVANWTQVAGAVSYYIEVDDITAKKPLVFTAIVDVPPANLTGLVADHHYEVRVYSFCSNGFQSAPTIAKFYTQGIIIDTDVIQLPGSPKDDKCGCAATYKNSVISQSWINGEKGCESYVIIVNDNKFWIRKYNNVVSIHESKECQALSVTTVQSTYSYLGSTMSSIKVMLGGSHIANVVFGTGKFLVFPAKKSSTVEIKPCNIVCEMTFVKPMIGKIDQNDSSEFSTWENNFEIYPSTVQDLLQIKYNRVEDGTTFTIIDLNGQRIAEFKANSEEDLITYEASSLKNGMYIVLMTAPNGERKVKRFVK